MKPLPLSGPHDPSQKIQLPHSIIIDNCPVLIRRLVFTHFFSDHGQKINALLATLDDKTRSKTSRLYARQEFNTRDALITHYFLCGLINCKEYVELTNNRSYAKQLLKLLPQTAINRLRIQFRNRINDNLICKALHQPNGVSHYAIRQMMTTFIGTQQ